MFKKVRKDMDEEKKEENEAIEKDLMQILSILNYLKINTMKKIFLAYLV